jgi:UDP-N-acetylglucosamine diphosphorylase/glucosamine-1-phosphate N-acetyltransferase
MNLLEDETVKQQLFPFTLTRPVADIRVGILTIREKWALALHNTAIPALPSHLLPTTSLVNALNEGKPYLPEGNIFIEFPWHIFQYNDIAIRHDFEWITSGRTSGTVSATNQVISPGNIFLEEGAKVECCVLNASAGPIYIGKNAEIMEGSIIRGPFALCEGAVVKMGTKIYGATTIGPYSVAGGEIKNAVIFGYSNKAHDGYLGDAVLGEWCNLGAGTTNSNLKNNASGIRIRNPITGKDGLAGLKCGLLMGDYSRSAINTSFNTGTVTGVCCNIFGEGLTPTYIPSFSWGSKAPARYGFEKALADIQNWKKFKNRSLTGEEIATLKNIFDNQ